MNGGRQWKMIRNVYDKRNTVIMFVSWVSCCDTSPHSTLSYSPGEIMPKAIEPCFFTYIKFFYRFYMILTC